MVLVQAEHEITSKRICQCGNICKELCSRIIVCSVCVLFELKSSVLADPSGDQECKSASVTVDSGCFAIAIGL